MYNYNMAIFQFIAENRGNPVSYYAATKSLGAYTRNIRCEWNKKYSKLNESTPQYNIYGIVGGAFGEYEVVQVSIMFQDEGTVSEKENLKFFCRYDKNCVNKNKHTYDKTEYQKDYYRETKKKTFRDLSCPIKLAQYGLV